MAPEHHAIYDELAAMRGRPSGPSTVVLYSPTLARPWNEISEYLHGQSVVEAQHAELAVSATAREYDCPYVWASHSPAARRAGVSEETLAAVRDRKPLDGLPVEEAAIVRFTRQLLQTNRVDSEVFDPLLKAHDPKWMVELAGWIGRYGALSGILNTFELTPGNDNDPLPVNEGMSASPREPARPLGSTPRLPQISTQDQVDEADRPVFNAIAEGRGSVRGPYSILMYSPPLCQRVFDVSNSIRFDTELSPRLREVGTLAAAREKDCAYVWGAHVPTAQREGVSDATIAVIRGRGDTSGLEPEDRDIVDFVRQVLRAPRS
jgi:4-carboxymuconolactone decarboxylase